MDIGRLKKLRRELDVFVRAFDHCIKTAPSRRHFRTYIRGQVSELERKCVAPIALWAGVAPRSLQEFLELKQWDHEAVRVQHQQLLMARHADPEGIGVIDESSYAKKGTKTVGVQRQYCGSTGKKDNCTVTVHLGYVAGRFHALVDSDVYLPESWLADSDRCREACIPEEVTFRPKWQIAVDLLKRSMANGVRLVYLTADEEYGRCQQFRQEVAGMGLIYVLEAPCSTKGWTKRPRLIEPPPGPMGVGRPSCRVRCVPGSAGPRRVDALWKRGGPSWRAFHIKDTDKGPVVWEARVCRFSPWEEGDLPGEEQWLIIARNVLDGELKYFLSNAPADAAIEPLLHVAFSRAHIEQLFEESKGQVGLDHFEVRHYQPLLRHLILSMVSLLFLAEQTEALGGEKSGLDDQPGPSCCRSATRPGDQPARADAPANPSFALHRILAAVEPRGGASPS